MHSGICVQLLRPPECARAEGGCPAADSSSIRRGVYAGNEVGYTQGEFRCDVRHSKLRVPGVRRKHGRSRQRVQLPGRVSDGLASALGADRFGRVNQRTPKATSRVDLNGWAPKLNDRCRYPGGRCPTAVDAGLRRGRLVWPSRSDASHQSAQAFTIQETTETL